MRRGCTRMSRITSSGGLWNTADRRRGAAEARHRLLEAGLDFVAARREHVLALAHRIFDVTLAACEGLQGVHFLVRRLREASRSICTCCAVIARIKSAAAMRCRLRFKSVETASEGI